MLRSVIKKTAIWAIGHASRFLPPWRSASIVDGVPQLEWLRVNSPVNLPQLPPRFASQFVRAKNIPARRIFELGNVCVTAEGVAFRNLRVFIPSLPWSKDLIRYQTGELLATQWKQTVRTLDEQPLILAYDNWALSNYYHWMIESLPRLFLAHSLYRDCRILLPYDVHEYVISSLELLGLKNFERISTDEIIRVPCLIMPEIIYYNGVENEDHPPQQHDVVVLHPLAHEELILPVRRKLLSTFKAAHPFRKVYISRSRSRMRRLVNEEDILPTLKASGFEIVYFEGMSLVEQIRLMQETCILAGVHGSNMVNILFLPTSAKVIELMNEHQLNDAFYLLASTIGIDYYSVPCSMHEEGLKNSSDSVLINDADLVVDKDCFHRVLNEALVPDTESSSVRRMEV